MDTGFAFTAFVGVSWLTYGGSGTDDDPQMAGTLGLSVLAGPAACLLSVGLAIYKTGGRPLRPIGPVNGSRAHALPARARIRFAIVAAVHPSVGCSGS